MATQLFGGAGLVAATAPTTNSRSGDRRATVGSPAGAGKGEGILAQLQELRPGDVEAVLLADQLGPGPAERPERPGVFQHPPGSIGQCPYVGERREEPGPLVGHQLADWGRADARTVAPHASASPSDHDSTNGMVR